MAPTRCWRRGWSLFGDQSGCWGRASGGGLLLRRHRRPRPAVGASSSGPLNIGTPICVHHRLLLLGAASS
eukprot:8236312-Pyramimonas_sp.AAC.1